jgi:hypothetical protein
MVGVDVMFETRAMDPVPTNSQPAQLGDISQSIVSASFPSQSSHTSEALRSQPCVLLSTLSLSCVYSTQLPLPHHRESAIPNSPIKKIRRRVMIMMIIGGGIKWC